MDTLTKEQRHKNMSRIRSCDTSIELLLRRALWHRGFRYRKNYKALPGRPDIAITKYRIAIFCDSEFFHGKDWDKLKLRLENGNNSTYWIKKIARNMERDMENERDLSFRNGLFCVFGERISKSIQMNASELLKRRYSHVKLNTVL